MGCDWSKSARVAQEPTDEQKSPPAENDSENAILLANQETRSAHTGGSKRSSRQEEMRDVPLTSEPPEPENFLAVNPGGAPPEEQLLAKPKLGIAALRPLPLPKKLSDGGSAGHASLASDDLGGKAVRPNTLPPIASKAAGIGSQGGKSAPATGGLAGAGSKGLVIPLRVEKAQEMPRERTEREIRTEKLRRFERECNRVRDFLFVGGEMAAANKELLLGLGITHVINLAASVIPNHFPDAFTYSPLYLEDVPGEDLQCHLYRLLGLIDAERLQGGRVLVHCHQGVSRSCSVCIAYLMLHENLSYEPAFDLVKGARGICNPNAGFCSQLVVWGKGLVRQGEGRGKEAPRLRAYRVERYSARGGEEGGLAPKLVTNSGGRVVLEEDKVYVLDATERVYMWVGRAAGEAAVACAREHVTALQRFEGAAEGRLCEAQTGGRAGARGLWVTGGTWQAVEEIREGGETTEVMELLRALRCLLPSREEGGGGDKGEPMSVDGEEEAEEEEEAEAEEEEERDGHGGGEGAQEGGTRRPEGGEEGVGKVCVPSLKIGGGGKEGGKGAGEGGGSAVVGMAGDGWGGGGGGGGPGGGEAEGGKGGEKGAGGEEGAEEGDPKGGKRMFEVKEGGGWREWEELANFDSDDLWSERAYIILDRTDDASEAYVWLGSACPAVAEIQDEEACETFARAVVVAFTKKTGLAVEAVTTVREGEEPEEFWDCFELG